MVSLAETRYETKRELMIDIEGAMRYHARKYEASDIIQSLHPDIPLLQVMLSIQDREVIEEAIDSNFFFEINYFRDKENRVKPNVCEDSDEDSFIRNYCIRKCRFCNETQERGSKIYFKDSKALCNSCKKLSKLEQGLSAEAQSSFDNKHQKERNHDKKAVWGQ